MAAAKELKASLDWNWYGETPVEGQGYSAVSNLGLVATILGNMSLPLKTLSNGDGVA